MSDEYIRKQDAVDAVAFGITIASAFNTETGERIDLFAKENEELQKAIERICELPSADVVPVIHGEWLNGIFNNKRYRCSICNYHISNLVRENYCPHCGARMDAQGDE